MTSISRRSCGRSTTSSSVARRCATSAWPSGGRLPADAAAPQHRSRRPRKPALGQLAQLDASPYAWFEDRGPVATLHGVIDDATSTPLALLLPAPRGSAWLRHAPRPHLPDVWRAAGAVRRPPQRLRAQRCPLDARRRGPGPPGPDPLRPHAAGPRHRLHSAPTRRKPRAASNDSGTRCRIVSPANCACGASARSRTATPSCPSSSSTSRAALRGRPPTLTPAWRPAPRDLADLLSCRYQRTVARDNTVHLGARWVQIPRGPRGRSYAGCRVEVRERLDGHLRVLYHGTLLASQPAPDPAFVLQPRAGTGRARRPPRRGTLRHALEALGRAQLPPLRTVSPAAGESGSRGPRRRRRTPPSLAPRRPLPAVAMRPRTPGT